MKNQNNLIGQRFRHLVVVGTADSYFDSKGMRQAQYLCLCDCGNHCIVRGSNLTTGHTSSCGCARNNSLYNHLDCPVCFGTTKVIETRPEEDCVNRRRLCLECGHKFSTVEIDMDVYKKLTKGKTTND